jgi:hypothetical protein
MSFSLCQENMLTLTYGGIVIVVRATKGIFQAYGHPERYGVSPERINFFQCRPSHASFGGFIRKKAMAKPAIARMNTQGKTPR